MKHLFIFLLLNLAIISLSHAVPSKPNLLLISIDALRQGNLGCYNYYKDTSPNIDGLAEEGVLFTQAISTSSFTAPTLVSLMTGTYPMNHGVMDWDRAINPEFHTMAEVFKKNGYSTAAFVAHDFFVSILGLNKGWDRVSTGIELDAHEITKRATSWLKEKADSNFFLWLHYFDLHEPYSPPEQTKVFDRNPFSVEKNHKIINSCFPEFDLVRVAGKDPPDEVINNRTVFDYYSSLYDRNLKFIDEKIGLLINWLKQKNLLENTLIIITADHGEAFGEHNLYFTHGSEVWEELIKIPLIIIHKKLLPKGGIRETQISQTDIFPTILELLKIKPLKQFDGRSFVPLFFDHPFKEKPVFSHFWSKSSVRFNGHKYYSDRTSNKSFLFNLLSDPNERFDISLYEPELDKLLKIFLDGYLKIENKEELFKKKAIDTKTLLKLRSLGYLQ